MGIKKITIKKGDNLTKLAKKYDTTVEDIVKINTDTIKDSNLIYAGNKLNIEDVNLNPMQTMKVIEDANKKRNSSMMTDNIARQKQNENYQKYYSKSDDTRVERDQSRTIVDMENGKAIKSVENANKNYSHTLDSYAYNSTNKADGNNGYEDKVAEASKHGFKPLGSESSNKTIYGTEKIKEYEQTLSAKGNSNDNYSQTLDSYNYQTNNKKTDGSNYSSRTIDDMESGINIQKVVNEKSEGLKSKVDINPSSSIGSDKAINIGVNSPETKTNDDYSQTLDNYAYNLNNKPNMNSNYEDKVATADKNGFKPLGNDSNKIISGMDKINEYKQSLNAKGNSNDNYSQTLDSYNYQANNKKTDGSNYSSRTIDDMTNGQAINRVANKENSGYYQQTQDIAEKAAKDYQDKNSGYERTIRRLEQEKNAHSQAYGRQVIYPEVDKSNTVANNTINNVNVENNATINDNSISAGTIDNQTLEQQIAMANAYENNNTANVDPYIAAASQTVAPTMVSDATVNVDAFTNSNNVTSSSGVNDGGFIMPTAEQREVVYKIIAAEGGNRSPQEAMNIASTMINRARAGNWTGGNDIYKLATAKDQYVVYQNGDAASAVLNADSRAAVDNLFAIASMGGSTTHNYQSFRSYGSTSYGGTILDPEHKGNRYK